MNDYQTVIVIVQKFTGYEQWTWEAVCRSRGMYVCT